MHDRTPDDPFVRFAAAWENFGFELRKVFMPTFRPVLDWLAERIGK